ADEHVLAGCEVEGHSRRFTDRDARDLADPAILFGLRRRAVDGKLVLWEVGLYHLKAVLHGAEVAHADLGRAGLHAGHVHGDLVVGELGDDLRTGRRV